MATYKTSRLLYHETLSSYQKSMSKYGSLPLTQYCKQHHVNYLGMKQWMSENKISIIDMRKSYSKSPSPPPMALSCSIVPICITNTDISKVSPQASIADTISKIKITYPTGIVLEVEEISSCSLKDLLSLPHKITV